MIKVFRQSRLVAVTIGAVLTLTACSPIRSLAALSRSTDHFLPFAGDNRIHIELGAEQFAAMVSPYLDESVTKVETAQYAPFNARPRIYLCATQSSYYRHTGQRSPAAVTNKLFLSPQLFLDHKPIDRYLTHELSHLHLVQQLGLFDNARLPSWFKEGLAELVSGGATGSSVTVEDAYKALHDNHSFFPDEGRNLIASFLFPRYGSYWNIENRLFYRQSMLFVEFLRDYDQDAFHRFFVDIENGTKFKAAFRGAYKHPVSTLWGQFVERGPANQAL